MAASDGNVLSATKIVDHGPDSDRFTVVIVGDGYLSRKLVDFHAHAQDFVNALRTTPPFDGLFGGINIYRIDVESDETGADDPGCTGGAPVLRNTYFDATFCSIFDGVALDHLLTIDDGLALSVATMHVPIHHAVVCIVNSTKYGGSGGTVATWSVHANRNNIALHEIGHSWFKLADEYEGDGMGTPMGEPSEQNVTRNPGATNKWDVMIQPATPLPSACNAYCRSSTCVPPATPPLAGAVGTYEGAMYSNCNIYRPLPSCYMRDYQPFCPVCSALITAILAPYQPVVVASVQSTIGSLVPSSIAFSSSWQWLLNAVRRMRRFP